MLLENTPRPAWLTFDCYGTLIQWDEGLLAAIGRIFERHGHREVDPRTLIAIYDRYEHALEQKEPVLSFRDVAAGALRAAMRELGLRSSPGDLELLLGSISAMPPFPEVPDALASLARAGFRLCVISNTDDDVISGNIAQLGGSIDRVVTAQQARAYKPSRRIFEHAHGLLGVTRGEVVHICASPHLDHAAARDLGFRCIWIDRGTGRTLLPDYTPDAIFPTLADVPSCFAKLGWL